MLSDATESLARHVDRFKRLFPDWILHEETIQIVNPCLGYWIARATEKQTGEKYTLLADVSLNGKGLRLYSENEMEIIRNFR